MKPAVLENIEGESTGRLPLGRKLSLLAKMRGLTQQQIADYGGISRIALNRFFCARTELRVSDLVRVLEILGIDLTAIINGALEGRTSLNNNGNKKDQDLFGDLIEVLVGLDPLVRTTLIEQISWWGQMSHNEKSVSSAARITKQLKELKSEVLQDAT